ncbi:MAG: ABC transporter ATP-binding protein/permease, partial [Pseudomonadales bacterium]|nr:ABC transporter ATP-binding protein/permease [Pseudomonadales bacterium]
MSKKIKEEKSLVWRTLSYYIWQLKKNLQYAIPLMILAPLAIVFNNYISAFLLAETINKLTTGVEVTWANYAPWILGFVAVMTFGELFCWRLVVWLHWHMETRIVYGLNRAAFDALSEQSMQFHNNRFGGSLVSQTNKFSSGYVRVADTIIFVLLPLIIGLIATFVILGPRLPMFTLFLGIFSAIFMIVAYFSYRRTLKLSEKEANLQTKLSGKLADSISNIVTVKSYGREGFEKDRFAVANRKVQVATSALIKAVVVRDFGFGAVIVAISALVVTTIVFGQQWFGVALGTLILAMQYSQLLLGNLWSSNRILRDFNRAFGDAKEMTEILDSQKAVFDKKGAKAIMVTKGKVDFNDITFRHADSPKSEIVFENFNLHVKPGQRVGLVGRSGSGKTTLTKLLLRFADV